MRLSGSQNTAVLVFTRNAFEEAEAKYFSPGKSASLRVAKKLISHTFGIVKKSGLPFLIIDSGHQQGNNFGERFTNAIQQTFDSGYENVIAIGNDCPELTTKNLTQAAKMLQHSDCVLGPATDGGIYLFAISKNAFDAEYFKNAPWQREFLFEYFVEHLPERDLNYQITETKRDIDNNADLKKAIYLFRNKAASLVNYLRSIISSTIKPALINRRGLILTTSLFTSGLRAPPIA